MENYGEYAFKADPDEKIPSLEEQATSLYGLLAAVTGSRETAEKLVLQELREPEASSARGFLDAAVKRLLPLFKGDGPETPALRSFWNDPSLEARLTWALQILSELKAEDKILILLRDQMEWSLARIGACFAIEPSEVRGRIDEARRRFSSQKEIMQTRRKWRA